MGGMGIDAPICQDDRLGGLDVCLARSIVCHDPLVDLAGEEAFEAPDDLAFGPAASSPSCDVVDGRLVESHADDDGSIEGGVGLSVATPIEAVPAGGRPIDANKPFAYFDEIRQITELAQEDLLFVEQ